MAMNPIEIIKADHQLVDDLFSEFEDMNDDSTMSRRDVADRIIEELTLHADMEETLCYPSFKEVLDEEDLGLLDEAYAEHAEMKITIERLKVMGEDHAEFESSMQQLIDDVRHHVEEEEAELLPKIEEKMSEEELGAMGDAMTEFKQTRVAAS
jgi:hemerythrin superfamily protein